MINLILYIFFSLPLVAYADSPYNSLPVGPIADEELISRHYLNANGLKVLKFLTPYYQGCSAPQSENSRKTCQGIAQRAVIKAKKYGYSVSESYFRSSEYMTGYVKAHNDATKYRELPTASQRRRAKYKLTQRQRLKFEQFTTQNRGSNDG
jgi:hypothetical protein